MNRRLLSTFLLVLPLLLTSSGLAAQIFPVAGPFEISPRSYGFTDPGTYEPRIPTVAALADGRFAVSWEERIEINPPGEPAFTFYDLYASKVLEDGTPDRLVRVDRGSAAGPQTVQPRIPELAADGRGGFVLAWERERFQGFDVLFQRVFPGRFVQQGRGRLLHRAQEGQLDRAPAVAANMAGGWVMAWEEWHDDHGLSRSLGIRAFRASGQPATEEIHIESPDAETALLRPRVAIQEDGSFFVIWGVFRGIQTPRLQGRSFAADGTPLSPIVQTGQGMNSWDVVAGDASSGDFLVAWQSGTGSESVARLRRYSPEGDRLTSKVLTRNLRNWRIASNRTGEIVFLWTDSHGSVRARLLDQNGVPQTPAFNVAFVSDEPWIGDLAVSDSGRIFAAWIDPFEVPSPGGGTQKVIVGRLWRIGGPGVGE